MANLPRLTDELGNFGFQIDGPEIWPVQSWRGGVGGWGGLALPPTPTNNLYVNRGWYPTLKGHHLGDATPIPNPNPNKEQVGRAGIFWA